MFCPCVLCAGEIELSERTINEHLTTYGHMKKVLLTDFIRHTGPGDKIFHKVLR